MHNNTNNEVEFTVKCKMKQKWMNSFCSMLKLMEKNGDIGCSEFVNFDCDGDGDFRPKFKINKPFKTINGNTSYQSVNTKDSKLDDYNHPFDMVTFFVEQDIEEK